MALVKMVAPISGSRNGVAWPAVGETLDVPADEAALLVATGIAEAAAAEAPVETATASSKGVETATAPKRRGA